ncbi:MAG: DNA pilot protein [Microviridae sp.]|nr:MAG: DNA pilot protein [Microviridae sp.]
MPGWVIPAIMGVSSLAQNLIQSGAQRRENRSLAEFQDAANRRYLDQQLDYNLPKNQMARFQEAGLNPNLIYGQGNPGNQSAPIQHPGVKPRDFSQMLNIAQVMNQTRMTDSQVSATQASVLKTTAQTELTRLQSLVAQKNPLLNEGSYNAIISSLISTADIKASEGRIKGQEADWKTNGIEITKGNGDFYKGSNGALKMDQELALLEQKFNLGTTDQAIKAKILESKEFQNAIMEVQKKFMTDFDITPQHIVTFIQLLLMKLL